MWKFKNGKIINKKNDNNKIDVVFSNKIHILNLVICLLMFYKNR